MLSREEWDWCEDEDGVHKIMMRKELRARLVGVLSNVRDQKMQEERQMVRAMTQDEMIESQGFDERTTRALKAATERIGMMNASVAQRTLESIYTLAVMQDSPDFLRSMQFVVEKLFEKWQLERGIVETPEDIEKFSNLVTKWITELQKKHDTITGKIQRDMERESAAKSKMLRDGVNAFLAAMKASPEKKHRVPVIDEGYVIRSSAKQIWKALILAAGIWNIPPTVKLAGDPGAGKTMFCQQFAAQMGAAFYKIDCAMFSEPGDLYGKLMPIADDDGKLTLVWKDSPFTEALTSGHCVILLDELTRLDYGGQNSLLPVLDGTSEVQPDGRATPIKRAPGTFILATCNEGVRHAGTYEITEALQSRLSVVFEVEELNKEEIVHVLRYSLSPAIDAGKSCLTDVKEAWSTVQITDSVEGIIWEVVASMRKAHSSAQNQVEEILPPSPRELFWLIRMIHVAGAEAWHWCLFNRYANESIGGGRSASPRASVIKIKTDIENKWIQQQQQQKELTEEVKYAAISSSSQSRMNRKSRIA